METNLSTIALTHTWDVALAQRIARSHGYDSSRDTANGWLHMTDVDGEWTTVKSWTELLDWMGY